MMKQLLDKGALRLRAANGKIGDVPRAGKPDGLPIIRQIIAGSIHWLVVVARAEAPDRIVLLEAEPEGIDYGVTALAILRPRQLRHLLAHRQVRSEVGIFESHGHRRRLK